MPSSSEMFSGEAPKGTSMFTGITSRNYGFEPTPEEFEKQMEALRYNKIVTMEGYFVKTFDLSVPDDVTAYTSLYTELYNKAAGGSVVIHMLDRQFIKDLVHPKWIVHIEWSEYSFKKEDLTEKQEDEATE